MFFTSTLKEITALINLVRYHSSDRRSRHTHTHTTSLSSSSWHKRENERCTSKQDIDVDSTVVHKPRMDLMDLIWMHFFVSQIIRNKKNRNNNSSIWYFLPFLTNFDRTANSKHHHTHPSTYLPIPLWCRNETARCASSSSASVRGPFRRRCCYYGPSS